MNKRLAQAKQSDHFANATNIEQFNNNQGGNVMKTRAKTTENLKPFETNNVKVVRKLSIDQTAGGHGHRQQSNMGGMGNMNGMNGMNAHGHGQYSQHGSHGQYSQQGAGQYSGSNNKLSSPLEPREKPIYGLKP